jgi:hypothetical protein
MSYQKPIVWYEYFSRAALNLRFELPTVCFLFLKYNSNAQGCTCTPYLGNKGNDSTHTSRRNTKRGLREVSIVAVLAEGRMWGVGGWTKTKILAKAKIM